MTTLMLGNLEVVVPAGDRCGEGVLWHDGEQAVYWTDINRFLLHRYDLASRVTQTWSFEAPIVALSLTTDPELMIVELGSGLALWSRATGAARHWGSRSRVGRASGLTMAAPIRPVISGWDRCALTLVRKASRCPRVAPTAPSTASILTALPRRSETILAFPTHWFGRLITAPSISPTRWPTHLGA